MFNKICGVLVVIGPILLALILSWIFVVCMVQLISFCLGMDLTLIQATGVWLVIILIDSLLNARKNNK